MDYHADPKERYQRGDYPVPKPTFPDDVKHGKGVAICKFCHKPEKHVVDPYSGKHRCTGQCKEWSVCRLLRFHEEERIRRDEIIRLYKRNQQAWCDQQNAMLLEARQAARVQQREENKRRAEEEKVARATDLALHQLGNPGELSRFLNAFGASEKSTWTPKILNNVLKRTRELDEEQETLGANKRQKLWVPDEMDLVDLIACGITQIDKNPKFLEEDSINKKLTEYRVAEQKNNQNYFVQNYDFIRKSYQYLSPDPAANPNRTNMAVSEDRPHRQIQNETDDDTDEEY